MPSWTFYSVPQVVKGLGSDRRSAVRAILIGLAINGVPDGTCGIAGARKFQRKSLKLQSLASRNSWDPGQG